MSFRKRKIMLRGRVRQLVWPAHLVPWVLEIELQGCLHQRMREADFGTVDGAIAGGFDEGEDFGVLRVTDKAIDSILRNDGISIVCSPYDTLGPLAYL